MNKLVFSHALSRDAWRIAAKELRVWMVTGDLFPICSNRVFAACSATIVLSFMLMSPQVARSATITLSPGADIQSAVEANPDSTSFVLTPGLYRMQSVVPKQGDSFVGQTGATMDGARILGNWTQAAINGVPYWTTAGGIPLSARCHAKGGACCLNDWQDCVSPQDLYVDNVEYGHANSFANMQTGRWYYDLSGTDGGTRNNVYLLDNPIGQTVELEAEVRAFTGTASNVTITNLIIEKYACPIASGAIQIQGPYWLVQGNEVRFNHSTGISAVRGGDHVQVLQNYVHHMGEAGVGGPANYGLWDSNTITYNNTNDVVPGWFAGGSKWVGHNIMISNNIVHDNKGPGLWSDVHARYDTYDNNTVYNNTEGIRYEVSEYGTITNNTIYGNGPAGSGFGQIDSVASHDVTVSGNTITVGITNPYGNGSGGIGVGNSGRRDGFTATHIHVTNNTVTFSSPADTADAVGLSDYANQSEIFTSDDNYFDYNTYYVPAQNNENWHWSESPTGQGPNGVTWNTWRAKGEDLHGHMTLRVSAPAP